MAVIKLYVSEEEKTRLRESAALAGTSLSSYILSRLKPSAPSTYIPPEGDPQPRSKYIFVRVTESEYNHILANANGTNLASYGRMCMLSGSHPITITISTDDITAFDHDLSEKLLHFQNIIEALAYRSVLAPQESEKLLSTLGGIRDYLKEITHITKNNRNSIRNAGLRWLKQRYKEKTEELQ